MGFFYRNAVNFIVPKEYPITVHGATFLYPPDHQYANRVNLTPPMIKTGVYASIAWIEQDGAHDFLTAFKPYLVDAGPFVRRFPKEQSFNDALETLKQACPEMTCMLDMCAAHPYIDQVL